KLNLSSNRLCIITIYRAPTGNIDTFLRMSSLFISSPLTRISNNSLSQGIFPDRLKYSEIRPLFKKGEKTNISNYMSISLLTSFSKVLEKAMST
ncbi:hypothetical protein B7P43_G16839, partial [Cryptotermes secundus]